MTNSTFHHYPEGRHSPIFLRAVVRVLPLVAALIVDTEESSGHTNSKPLLATSSPLVRQALRAPLPHSQGRPVPPSFRTVAEVSKK